MAVSHCLGAKNQIQVSWKTQVLLLTTEPLAAQFLLFLHLPRGSWFRAACGLELWEELPVFEAEVWEALKCSSAPCLTSYRQDTGVTHHQIGLSFWVYHFENHPESKISVRLAAPRGSLQCTMCRNQMVQDLCVISLHISQTVTSSIPHVDSLGLFFVFPLLTVVSLGSLSICRKGQTQGPML